ncbi:hypothetical protein TELCIR_20246 [Teladorsagia circumcincta]|uniref:Uncharacterized protein n=1 Tax=Teladorsagia circumcincta TaxID=45464 RepID=A0A2G9TK38_TELCI|nr:hypothetical protein TELCIR_20246 [Teladorsagia circumcincta]
MFYDQLRVQTYCPPPRGAVPRPRYQRSYHERDRDADANQPGPSNQPPPELYLFHSSIAQTSGHLANGVDYYSEDIEREVVGVVRWIRRVAPSVTLRR